MRKYQLISNYYEIEILKKYLYLQALAEALVMSLIILKFLTKNKIKKKFLMISLNT